MCCTHHGWEKIFRFFKDCQWGILFQLWHNRNYNKWTLYNKNILLLNIYFVYLTCNKVRAILYVDCTIVCDKLW